jgi:hypothetical protein
MVRSWCQAEKVRACNCDCKDTLAHDVYVGIRSSISARYNKSPYPSASLLTPLLLVAPVKQLPLLLLLQGSHVAAVTAEGDDIISAFAELPSGSTSFYSTHYSGQGCNNSTSSSSFVSLRGFLPGNSSTYHPGPDANGTCAALAVCAVLFDSMDDSRCPVEGSFTGGGVREDGHVYLDYMQSITDFTQCGPSGWYPGCYFEYYPLGVLKSSPDLLANSDPADLEAMKDFIYYTSTTKTINALIRHQFGLPWLEKQ